MGDEFDKTIQFNKELGNKFLIVPGLAEERRNSVHAWTETAKIFNELAAKAKSHGMRVGYHNHWDEFKPMDGQLPFDVFFGNTVSDVVMQFDTGNAFFGGAETAPFLKKYAGRAATVHLKECSRNEEVNFAAMFGEGSVPWKEVFQLCATIGKTEWHIIEQEKYLSPPMESVAEGLRAVKALLA
jgi:sugar phosphate isomerase/epimerase